MKKAVIYLENYHGKSSGDIERILDHNEEWKIFLLTNGICGKIDIDASIEDEAKHLLYAELIPDTPSFYSDGVDKYNNSTDVPQVDDGNGNMIFDETFVFTPFSAEHWEIKLDQTKKDTEAALNLKNAQEQQYINAIDFGFGLAVSYGTENALMGITQDMMTKTVRQAMSEVTNALQTGSLRDAMDELKLIPEGSKDAKYITDARMLEFINKIETYLGDPLSTNL